MNERLVVPPTPPRGMPSRRVHAIPSDPEKVVEILEKVAREEADAFFDRLLRAFPNWQVPPAAQAPASQRYQRYLDVTYVQDIDQLMEPKYVSLYEDGLIAPPASPFWLNLLSVKPVFRTVQRDFIQLAQAEERKG